MELRQFGPQTRRNFTDFTHGDQHNFLGLRPDIVSNNATELVHEQRPHRSVGGLGAKAPGRGKTWADRARIIDAADVRFTGRFAGVCTVFSNSGFDRPGRVLP